MDATKDWGGGRRRGLLCPVTGDCPLVECAERGQRGDGLFVSKSDTGESGGAEVELNSGLAGGTTEAGGAAVVYVV